MTFDPTPYATLPKHHCVPRKYIRVCEYNTDHFVEFLTIRWMTLDDLWPHICWGHMYNSTKASMLCSSPTDMHHSMWIQDHFQKLLPICHILILYIHTCVIHSLFLKKKKKKIRQDNKVSTERPERPSFSSEFKLQHYHPSTSGLSILCSRLNT